MQKDCPMVMSLPIHSADGARPNLLFACGHFPAADDNDGRRRMWQLLQLGCVTHEITCVSLADGPIHLPQWRRVHRCVRTLDLRVRRPWFTLRRLAKAVRERAGVAGPFDAVVTDVIGLLPTFRTLGVGRVVLNVTRQDIERKTTQLADADVLLLDRARLLRKLPESLHDRSIVLPRDHCVAERLAWDEALAIAIEKFQQVMPLRRAA